MSASAVVPADQGGSMLGATTQYWRALSDFLIFGQTYSESKIFNDDQWAKVQVYSLSIIFKIWSKPHYRSPSFQQDMIDNLRNVAVPGTGLPLSIFCHSKLTCLLYVLFVNPTVCFWGAVNKARRYSTGLFDFFRRCREYYCQHLLHPDDWFSFWRLNCRLVSLHSLLTQCGDYRMEDKWTFLREGKALSVPVSPYFDDVEAIVCKNKNIEGGMGIHFYRNAVFGGDWILQEKLGNAAWLSALLPPNSPLSTMRVITTSTWSLSQLTEDGSSSNSSSGSSNGGNSSRAHEFVRAESGLLRLGRANASTDHSSILFDVDISSGSIKAGTSNAHWYQLGLLSGLLYCPWLPQQTDISQHPDAPNPIVRGQKIPDIRAALDIVVESHFRMMPGVPIVGWDVAFTNKGVFLLEVNLSCNFFRGSFDIPRYIGFVDKYWTALDRLERQQSSNSSSK